MESWRSKAESSFCGAASATFGLADVVRGGGRLSAKPVVHQFLLSIASGFAGSHSASRKKSVSERSSAIYPRRRLRIQVYRFEDPRSRGNLVAARIHRPILPNPLTPLLRAA